MLCLPLLSLTLLWARTYGQDLSAEDQDFLAQLQPGGSSGGGQQQPAAKSDQYRSCDVNKYCVPYYLCENENIVTDGAGLIDIRFGGADGQESHPQHSDCGEVYTDVCCASPLQKPNPNIIDPVPQVYTPQCGRRNVFGVHARILGLQSGDTQFGEFPWMAIVLRRRGEEVLFVCGASLIHPQVVLTAAHCVYNVPDLVVRLGEWNTQNTTELYPHVDLGVQKVSIHPGYNDARRNLHNDVALLFLDEPVQLQEHIDTICLPNPLNPPQPGANCVATGYGKDRFGNEGLFQVVLRSVDLKLVDKLNCQDALRGTRLGKFFQLHSGFTCAGGDGSDTCKGDGGSPLACPDPSNPDRYVQSGIVSWGIGCGENGVPGVYVDVAYYTSWVDQQVTQYFGLPSSYFGLPPSEP